ncbi:hypothetical protein KDH_79960 [Dictyobacter sp. S3.2.2.5]|uniref:CDP-diacylglycerol--glycerol-3-phosphate 3-phosphatidyltransferase n=1 Tax=Dictyobacter halimunensis TaxID=3026934 RepID=A0ABQ6G4Y6_9CHLR|nr:hypothetical protein KDH_79960 [Dictyobacter sp. S3.2.2.5]
MVIAGIFLYFPLPWKMWGTILLCVVLGSQMVWRFMTIIAPSYARKLLPYIVATFLVLVPFYAFGHGLYQLVAIIVFAAIIGITGFYWFVWAVVSSFQEVFLGKKR